MRGWCFAMVLAWGIWPAEAAGECKILVPALSPASGTLPPDPVLFVFVPTGGNPGPLQVTVEGRGGAIPTRMTLLSRAPAFESYRLAVRAAAGEELRVKVARGATDPFAARGV